MYIIKSYYCQSQLTVFERKAAEIFRILDDKIVTVDQISSLRGWMESVADKLEMQNPRCKRVKDIVVDENRICNRLDIRFGNLYYNGFPCSFLKDEEMRF